MSVATAASQPHPDRHRNRSRNPRLDAGLSAAAGQTITFQNGSFRSFPELRWAWSNIRQLVPTVNVWRGAGPASVLPRAEQDIGASASVTMDGRPMTFARMLEETYADGIAVLHRGKLIYERYFGALKPHKPHIAMSVTKSFTGTLAGILVGGGQDRSAGAGHGLCAGAEGERVRRCARARGHGYDHGPRIHRGLHRQEFRRVRACGGRTAWRRSSRAMTARPTSSISSARRRSRASTARPLPTRPSIPTCWPGSAGAPAA